MSDGTQSVLDSMTAGILDRKAGKSAPKPTLTPVAGETPALPSAPLAGTHDVAFPYDSADTVQRALANARREIEHVLAGITALEALYGQAPTLTTEVTRLDVERIASREAEAKADAAAAAQPPIVERGPNEFADEFADKARRAQAQVFGDAPPASGSPAPGWVCPEHGAASTEEKTSRKGRKYRVCRDCMEFEK